MADYDDVENSEELESVRKRMLSERENSEFLREQPALILLEEATATGGLGKYDLLRCADQGNDVLELLTYVEHKDVSGGVDVPEKSAEPGCYLAIPSYYATRFIEKEDAHIDTFVLPKAFFPRAGLVVMQQIAGVFRDRTIKTKQCYHIKIDQGKIWVVRQQAEKFYNKCAVIAPLSIVQRATTDSGQKADQGSKSEQVYQQPTHPTEATTGGRRVAALPEEEFLNQKKLLAHFYPAVWNTIKRWARQFGIQKPEKGDPWPIVLKDAISIKAEHHKYYKTKKFKKKQK